MRLECERKQPIEKPTEKQLVRIIDGLRSYGPSSFASLTKDDGEYLQVAGGGVTCLLERRDAKRGQHFRAYHDRPNKSFPDGTLLVFSGGSILLNSNEWFTTHDVKRTFLAFLRGEDWPHDIHWRDITNLFKSGKDA